MPEFAGEGVITLDGWLLEHSRFPACSGVATASAAYGFSIFIGGNSPFMDGSATATLLPQELPLTVVCILQFRCQQVVTSWPTD